MRMRLSGLRWLRVTALLAACLLLGTAGVIVAADGFAVEWFVASGGGGRSSGGSYRVDGTIGQALASTSSGGSYTLDGGFMAGFPLPYKIYLPLVQR